jgi:hypothetical protein
MPEAATMQTDGPLKALRMSSTTRPMDTLIWWQSPEHGLDMDQPYQRGVVWGPTRQRNLIRSLLVRIPIPSLIVNDRLAAGFTHAGWSEKRCLSNAVIDGKQRITSILRFLNGDLSVPASWFPADRVEETTDTEDGPYVTFPGLTVVGQRHFRNLTIGICEGRVATLDAEAAVFDLVNFGGLAQGRTDDDRPEEG